MPRRTLIPYLLLLVLTILALGAAALAVAQGPGTVSPTSATGYTATHCTDLHLENGSGCLYVRVSSKEEECVATGLRRIVATAKHLAPAINEAKALIAKCEGSDGH